MNFYVFPDYFFLTFSPMAIRRINDQLLLLERAFLDPNGLPRNVLKRHIILSPSETSPPYDEMFPGLMDEFTLLIHHGPTGEKISSSWDVIRAHYSILVYTIQSAAATISDIPWRDLERNSLLEHELFNFQRIWRNLNQIFDKT